MELEEPEGLEETLTESESALESGPGPDDVFPPWEQEPAEGPAAALSPFEEEVSPQPAPAIEPETAEQSAAEPALAELPGLSPLKRTAPEKPPAPEEEEEFLLPPELLFLDEDDRPRPRPAVPARPEPSFEDSLSRLGDGELPDLKPIGPERKAPSRPQPAPPARNAERSLPESPPAGTPSAPEDEDWTLEPGELPEPDLSGELPPLPALEEERTLPGEEKPEFSGAFALPGEDELSLDDLPALEEDRPLPGEEGPELSETFSLPAEDELSLEALPGLDPESGGLPGEEPFDLAEPEDLESEALFNWDDPEDRLIEETPAPMSAESPDDAALQELESFQRAMEGGATPTAAGGTELDLDLDPLAEDLPEAEFGPPQSLPGEEPVGQWELPGEEIPTELEALAEEPGAESLAEGPEELLLLDEDDLESVELEAAAADLDAPPAGEPDGLEEDSGLEVPIPSTGRPEEGIELEELEELPQAGQYEPAARPRQAGAGLSPPPAAGGLDDFSLPDDALGGGADEIDLGDLDEIAEETPAAQSMEKKTPKGGRFGGKKKKKAAVPGPGRW